MHTAHTHPSSRDRHRHIHDTHTLAADIHTDMHTSHTHSYPRTLGALSRATSGALEALEERDGTFLTSGVLVWEKQQPMCKGYERERERKRKTRLLGSPHPPHRADWPPVAPPPEGQCLLSVIRTCFPQVPALPWPLLPFAVPAGLLYSPDLQQPSPGPPGLAR